MENEKVKSKVKRHAQGRALGLWQNQEPLQVALLSCKTCKVWPLFWWLSFHVVISHAHWWIFTIFQVFLYPSFCESRYLHITSATITLRRKYQYTPSEAILFFCNLECCKWCLVHRNLPGQELNMMCHGGKGTFSFGKMWNFCFQPSNSSPSVSLI